MEGGTPSHYSDMPARSQAGEHSLVISQPVQAIRELLSVAYPSCLFCSLVRLPRNRSPGPVHERLHLLQGKLAIFVAVHCLENSFVSRLKLLQ
jgi:hypothetical protein